LVVIRSLDVAFSAGARAIFFLAGIYFFVAASVRRVGAAWKYQKRAWNKWLQRRPSLQLRMLSRQPRRRHSLSMVTSPVPDNADDIRSLPGVPSPVARAPWREARCSHSYESDANTMVCTAV
jgi:hypothetical protein